MQLNELWRIFSGSERLSNSFPDLHLPQRSILFTSSFTSTFVRNDLALLRRRFAVEHLLTRGPQAIPRIAAAVIRHDVTYTWFASLYAFVVVACARLLGKPSFVVIAGVDVMHVEGVRYGPWRSPVKRLLVGWTLRHATAVLPVVHALRESAVRLADYDGSNMTVVPTGYDSTFWHPAGTKERGVLCVAGCETRVRLLVKGIDVLFALARIMEGERFILAGTEPAILSQLGEAVPLNVQVLPSLPPEELRAIYQKCKVYVQPSRSEGLPNAVCEAMLCGCIPVGTDVGGMHEAIGDTGFVVAQPETHALVGAITQALDAQEELGLAARAHIIGKYTVEQREAALSRLLQEATR